MHNGRYINNYYPKIQRIPGGCSPDVDLPNLLQADGACERLYQEYNKKIIDRKDKFIIDYEKKLNYYGSENYVNKNIITHFMYNRNGKIFFCNGDIYEGESLNNMREGKGKLIFSNGNTYEGDFENDRIHGYGKMTYKYGIVKLITGYWKDENNVYQNDNTKFIYNDVLLEYSKNLIEEIQTFSIFPNFIHRYIPVLGKETKRLELEFCIKKNLNIQQFPIRLSKICCH